MSRSWTRKPHFCGERAFFKRFLQSSTGLLCVLLLSACGESTPRGYSGGAVSSPSDTLKPIAAPPGAGESPPLPGTTGIPKTPDGLPTLQALGNNTQLFSQKLSNENARLDRLENAVQEIRNDFDAMAPAITRLVAIEKDIQNLLVQLEVLTGKDPQPVEPIDSAMLDSDLPMTEPTGDIIPPVSPALDQPMLPSHSAPEIIAAPPETPPAPQPSPAVPDVHSATVKDIRIGEHPDKIRIVLDLDGKPSFTADLDNNEKILIVELPKTGWNTQVQKNISGNPLLSSYDIEPMDDGGTMLVLQLKKASSISYKTAIGNPDGSSRIVIDLLL